MLQRIIAFTTLGIAALVAAPAAHSSHAPMTEEPPALEASDFDKAYASRDGGERARAVAALGGAPDAAKFALISRKVLPREKRPDVLARAVRVLQSVEDPAVVAKILAAARRKKGEPRLVYVEALARLGGHKGVHAAVLGLLENDDRHTRGMAAYALGEHRDVDALEPLLGLLDDPAWTVRAAALAALPRLRDEKAVKARALDIVAYLETADGRLARDAAEALRRITGKRLGVDAPAWRRFLSTGVLPERRTGDGYATDRPHYYGIDVHSNRVVIVLDTSFSMAEAIEIDRARFRRETERRRREPPKGKTGTKDEGAKQYEIPWWRIKTRMDLARYQTMNLVSQLREEQSFDVIVFSTRVRPWMGRLVPANSANKQKALKMLEGLEPDDKTNTWGALRSGFDLGPGRRGKADEGPDEMFLVTDGAPSVGDIVDPDEMFEAAVQLWRVRRVRINAIGIGVKLPFLKKLARRTGGTAKFFE